MLEHPCLSDVPASAAHLSPFYLREHSKRILRGALYNDSKFLEDINVMDYSLVVGVDSRRNELVVGIVGESLVVSSRKVWSIHISSRLHPDLHVGQETGELGERIRFLTWRGEG